MFNENFKKYRNLSGMTQEEVANFLFVTPQAVSKWETGNGTPDISLLVPIAEIFGISTDELLGNTARSYSFIAETDGESYEERYEKYQNLLKYNPTNSTFFSKEERAGNVEIAKINNCIDIAFSELYGEENKKRNELREMKYYESIDEHPFLSKFKNDKHDINKNAIDEHINADLVLID
jgi:transcriptional regulator with XRE-family HTH domain